LWIGGNRPYGKYFKGLIDQVRVYDRVLGPAELRSEMSTPIGGRKVVADASGHGHAGTIVGATWVARGRFGGALRFHGNGASCALPRRIR
jgi:Concanavalin A-like lectin/glucanases superfamily